MKSALITIFLSMLLVSCTKDNTVVPEEETPKKVYEDIKIASGLYTDIRLLGKASESFLRPGDFPPDFLINENRENEFSLSDLRGKVVFLEFWRTGCHLCVQSIPSLVSAYNNINNDDFLVITITTDKTSIIDRLFKAGSHFGFKKRRRHPTVTKFLFTTKGKALSQKEIDDINNFRKMLE